MNRFSSRRWGEEKVGKKRTEGRGREDTLPLTPFALDHFTLSQSPSALPAAVRPFQPGPVHRPAQSLFLNTTLPEGELTFLLISILFCSFYTYDWNTATLLSVTVGEQTTRYTYSFKGELTSIIYPTSTTVKYSWNQYGLLSNITGYNQENKFVQGMYFSYDWNGKVTMSRLPQGDSAVLVFNEDARMMDIVGGGFSGVRFDSVKNDDQVVRIIRQGEQVLKFLNYCDFLKYCQTSLFHPLGQEVITWRLHKHHIVESTLSGIILFLEL